ncbi:MAG: alanine racemase [Desulfobacteraceae bacterium]|jgi:diaminopimelate decarboxylase
MTGDPLRLIPKLQATLGRETPLLPAAELQAFVAYHFDRREVYLGALDRQPAPLYLQETAVLRQRAQQLKEAFGAVLPAASYYYAVKSNNHPEISRILLSSGFGLDVSSGLELEMALGLGAREIIFSGPGKTEAELRLAADHADRVVVLMDSFGELQRLAAIAAGMQRPVPCGVRLTVGAGGLWRKFGISPDALPAFWREARRFGQIRLQGLQFHSSWNLAPDNQAAFIRLLGGVLADLPAAARAEIAFIDIGGGYWPPQGEWLQPSATPRGRLLTALGQPPEAPEIHHRLPATPIEVFADRIAGAIRRHIFNRISCRICLEPGRWICNDAVHLLISVVDRKAPDLVITDAGTNAVGWERFESDYFPVLNLSRPALTEKPCHILGSLCTPHDVWGYHYFGADIQPGDILMIPTQGAYTYSLRQNFIKPLPAVLTI